MRTSTCSQSATTDTRRMRRGVTHVTCARTSVHSCAHLQIPHTSGLWEAWSAMREQFDFCAASAQRLNRREDVIGVLEGCLSSAVNDRRSKNPRPFGLDKHFELNLLREASTTRQWLRAALSTLIPPLLIHVGWTAPLYSCLACQFCFTCVRHTLPSRCSRSLRPCGPLCRSQLTQAN